MPTESEKFLKLAPLPPRRDAPEIRFRYRLISYLVTWTVSALWLFPHIEGVLFLPVLPLGLMMLFPDHAVVEDVVMAIGWLFYIVNGIVLLCTRRVVWFGLFYFIFFAVLLTNILGCRVMLEGLSKIGH